jgi:type I restriction enzyme M protein
LEEIKAENYKLDAFKWLRDEETEGLDDLPDPEELLSEAMEELRRALDDLAEMQKLLDDTGPLR